jgi:hypothetical protein
VGADQVKQRPSGYSRDFHCQETHREGAFPDNDLFAVTKGEALRAAMDELFVTHQPTYEM